MTADNLDALKGVVDKLLAEATDARKTAEASLSGLFELNAKIAGIISAVLGVFGSTSYSFVVDKYSVRLFRTVGGDIVYFIYFSDKCIFCSSDPYLTLKRPKTIAFVLSLAVDRAKRRAEWLRSGLERARSVLGSVVDKS